MVGYIQGKVRVDTDFLTLGRRRDVLVHGVSLSGWQVGNAWNQCLARQEKLLHFTRVSVIRANAL